ncbi:hypothetical protein Ciccas_001086 [Cichlidogyrus casuarinus]|uniref:Uncharacterized protein n=1 Tax=Cichlidogyrus casuarinus TaxID=1844966 RepID=A0ABD2QL07_9PLAT
MWEISPENLTRPIKYENGKLVLDTSMVISEVSEADLEATSKKNLKNKFWNKSDTISRVFPCDESMANIFITDGIVSTLIFLRLT